MGNIERCWVTFTATGRPEAAFESAEDAARDVLADERASYAVEYAHADLLRGAVSLDALLSEDAAQAAHRAYLTGDMRDALRAAFHAAGGQ